MRGYRPSGPGRAPSPDACCGLSAALRWLCIRDAMPLAMVPVTRSTEICTSVDLQGCMRSVMLNMPLGPLVASLAIKAEKSHSTRADACSSSPEKLSNWRPAMAAEGQLSKLVRKPGGPKLLTTWCAIRVAGSASRTWVAGRSPSGPGRVK